MRMLEDTPGSHQKTEQATLIPMLWNIFLRYRKQNRLEKQDKRGFPCVISMELKIFSILGCLISKPHPCVWMHGKGDLSKPPAFPGLSGKPNPMGMLFLLGQSQPQTFQFPPSHHHLPSPAVTSWGFVPKTIKFLSLAITFISLLHFIPGKHKNCECFSGTFLHFRIQAIKEPIPLIYFTFLA